ncbi:conserved hypothetical protein [Rubrivivax sp. A210]|uniref:DUF484 family protein n=1 Tax=Rubrivivax sp. A210 TaxID=2772301 RepID=UPI00191A0ED7|nr:DUF484 family protein [Rubrivivax sp. A210]CAD5374218.1 conserved hypothetical protein [Rubrivivax sp. A210]
MSNPTGPSTGVHGITEADIANYLANTPGFFERHADLLASVHLTSPHGQRAVSLQERQMEMLRERIKGLEMRIVEMIRHGQENLAIADRLHRCTRSVLLTADARELPARLVESLQHEFMIPQAAIRLWGLGEALAAEPWAQPASSDVQSFTASLTVPYCGVNAGFEAARWFAEPSAVMSLAMIPLRHGDTSFGLLVLGSPDPTRYAADMGTDFLQRVGEIAGAALSRLRTPA